VAFRVQTSCGGSAPCSVLFGRATLSIRPARDRHNRRSGHTLRAMGRGFCTPLPALARRLLHTECLGTGPAERAVRTRVLGGACRGLMSRPGTVGRQTDGDPARSRCSGAFARAVAREFAGKRTLFASQWLRATARGPGQADVQSSTLGVRCARGPHMVRAPGLPRRKNVERGLGPGAAPCSGPRPGRLHSVPGGGSSVVCHSVLIL